MERADRWSARPPHESGRRPCLGIIGGMGPQATCDLFDRILRHTPAAREADHLHVIIDNDPDIPNRHDSIRGRGPSAVPKLVGLARNLERSGADVLLMPCNTAHAYAGDIRAAVSIPLLNMIDLTSDAIAAPGVSAKGGRVGLLAADGCLAAGLYQQSLADRGLRPIVLPRVLQDQFMDSIAAVKLGSRDGARAFNRFAQALLAEGADVVVAACTEASVALRSTVKSYSFVDSTDVLARAAVAYATASQLA